MVYSCVFERVESLSPPLVVLCPRVFVSVFVMVCFVFIVLIIVSCVFLVFRRRRFRCFSSNHSVRLSQSVASLPFPRSESAKILPASKDSQFSACCTLRGPASQVFRSNLISTYTSSRTSLCNGGELNGIESARVATLHAR